MFILLQLDREISLLQEDLIISRQFSKSNISILSKMFRIICIYYLSTLYKLLIKLIILIILTILIKRNLYKYN